MSMISAQIDELRELAGDGSMEWVSGPVRASVLRDAADTIWQLRDDLQRANNAVQDAEHDESMAWDRVRKAEAENAKLREYIDLKETCWKHVGWCAECPYNGVDDEHDNCNCTAQEKIESLARELEVEV